MSDSVLMFPNALQPTAALKTYAPFGVRFWESEETVLSGMKEFTEGWFARRQTGTHAALEAARSIGEAQHPLDVLRIYQDWLNGATARLVEDGLAYQSQVLKSGTKLSAAEPAPRQAETAARPAPDSAPRSVPDEQRYTG
jgi:hypothetical protein